MDEGNLLFDLPPAPAGRRTRSHPPAPWRSGMVRDTLLAFLTEPHTVKEIAVGTDKAPSNVTGHLRAMRRKNLVVRLSWGVWVRRDRCDAAPDYASIRLRNPLQELLMEHLTEPKTVCELQEITKRRRGDLMKTLTTMIKRGTVEQHPDERFAAVHE